MGDFFHGWRRKIGVGTLVLALLFAAGWVRSLSGGEVLVIPIVSSGGLLIISGYGYFGITASPEIGNQIVVEPIPDSDWHLFRSFIAIPYWAVVIPLTMLSAYLLLVKPRTNRISEVSIIHAKQLPMENDL